MSEVSSMRVDSDEEFEKDTPVQRFFVVPENPQHWPMIVMWSDDKVVLAYVSDTGASAKYQPIEILHHYPFGAWETMWGLHVMNYQMTRQQLEQFISPDDANTETFSAQLLASLKYALAIYKKENQ